ncbi:MAG: Sulfotransferase [Sphingomonas bacterium]|nr:Sulfotransferase [Sphingomonas bacterium]
MGGNAIWLASYPKSGNTWIRLALKSLLAEGSEVALDDIARFGTAVTGRRLFDDMLEVESGHLTDAEVELLRPVLHDVLFASARPEELVKVHDAWFRTAAGRPLFDAHHSRAAIYVLRDPRDVAISWARFSAQPIDWAIAFLANPIAVLAPDRRGLTGNVRQFLGAWSAHVTSWIDDSALAPLVVRYEDMHADPAATLARIAAHLDWPASGAAIGGAVAATRFDRLAEQEERHGFAEMPDSASRFFVSGRAGGWRDILSAEQAATIERDHDVVMRRFGYL